MSDTKAHPLLPSPQVGTISLNRNVEVAVHEAKQLSGLMPLCAWCHQVRNDEGYWQQIESYLKEHTRTKVTHGICPDCAERVKQDRVTLRS